MSVPADRFDEIRRKWIARHQHTFIFQKRRAEILARQIRDRAAEKSGARVDPADDDVIHPLIARPVKTIYAGVDMAIVCTAALLAPLGWMGGKAIYRMLVQLIPGELRSFPVAACTWAAVVVGAPLALLYQPTDSLAGTVLAPWLLAQLPAALLTAGIYGILEGWLAVDGARDWWPMRPPPENDEIDFGLEADDLTMPGVFRHPRRGAARRTHPDQAGSRWPISRPRRRTADSTAMTTIGGCWPSRPHTFWSAVPPAEARRDASWPPAAVLWGGPAVVVSSKDDLFQLVMERRYGPKALIDLRPDYDADYPGVDMMSFDPTKLISTPDQAVTAANTMMQMSAVGLGSGIDQVSDGGIWESNTEGPLAAMLYAASPKGNNAGIEWVLLAVDNMRLEDPNSQMSLEPGWQMAADIVSNMPLFHNALMRTLLMDHRQRDSIALTMRKAVMPWMRLALRGITHRRSTSRFCRTRRPRSTCFPRRRARSPGRR